MFSTRLRPRRPMHVFQRRPDVLQNPPGQDLRDAGMQLRRVRHGGVFGEDALQIPTVHELQHQAGAARRAGRGAIKQRIYILRPHPPDRHLSERNDMVCRALPRRSGRSQTTENANPHQPRLREGRAHRRQQTPRTCSQAR